jgi:tight adherence protein B
MRVVDVLAVAVLLAAIAAAIFLWLRIRVQRRSRERLAIVDESPSARGASRLPGAGPRFVRRHYLIPWIAGAVVSTALYFLLGWPVLIVVAFGVIVGLVGGEVEQYRVDLVAFKIEQQLADMIDLMVAALQAGAGTMSAMENAVQETKRPLRPQMDEVFGRIRYGDDPPAVLRALEVRVPLEPFRLFVSALTVHWETGGSLGPTLATVGRVIRDRVEVTRRIRSLTTQGRLSVGAVLFLTFFLAIIMWRNDPDRMTDFLATTVGQVLTAGVLMLQGFGVAWTARLSRLKY